LLPKKQELAPMRRFDNIAGLMVTLVLSIIAFFGLMALTYFVLKYFAVGLDKLPFFEKSFVFTILSLPAFIFLFAWGLFFKRIKNHSSKVIKKISYIIAGAAILGTLFFYAKDLIRLFGTWNDEVTSYNIYSRYFIVTHIIALFVTAMLQALTLPKEKDWMERGN
jgi:hypothetical protein